MGQAASQAHRTASRRPALTRRRGGSLRSALQSSAFAGLFVSGLHLWLWPETDPILWLHMAIGLALIPVFSHWMVAHLPKGLRQSQRRGFTFASWALLIAVVTVLLSGAVMAVPGLLWLGGRVWFPPRGITEALSFLHFWGAWIAFSGLILHLAMRHWHRDRT